MPRPAGASAQRAAEAPAGPPALIGREEEVRAARDLLVRGSGRVVWTGDPGSGKTLLLEHLAGRCERAGARVLSCSGLGGAEGEVASVVDTLELPCPTPHGVARAPGATIARSDRTVLVVDDLDRVDADARARLMVALARRPAPVVLLAAATHPPDGEPCGFELRPLPPLTPLDAVAMLASRGGPVVAPHVLAGLVRELAGVPGAVLETVRILSEDQCRGLVEIPDPVPVAPSVRRYVHELLDPLGSQDRVILLTAAVAATRRTDVLLHAVGTDVDGLLASGAAEHIDLVAGHVAVRDRRVRAVVHDEAGVRERTRAHQRLAEAAHALGEHVAADWHHALAALEGDPGLVAPLGATASALLARGEAGWAVRVARESLAHARDAQRPAALALLGRAALRANLLGDARDALQEAAEDPRAAAAGASADLLVALTRASGHVPGQTVDGGGPALQITAAVLHAGRGDTGKARDVLASCGTGQRAPALAAALDLVGATVALAEGDPVPAIDTGSRPVSEPVLAELGTALGAVALSASGRAEEARAALAATAAEGRAARGRDPWAGLVLDGQPTASPWPGGQAFARSCTSLSEVLVELHAGDLSRTRALLAEAAMEAPLDQCLDGVAALLCGRVAVLCDGQTDALADTLADLLAQPAPPRIRRELARTRALARFLRGESRRAAGVLAQLEERDDGAFWACLPTFSRAEVSVLAGARSTGSNAAGPGPCASAADSRPACAGAIGRARQARQSLALAVCRGDAPDRLMADALAAALAIDNPFEAGQTHLLVGRLLHRAGRWQEGSAHLMSALDRFEAAGAGAVAARTRVWLREPAAGAPAEARVGDATGRRSAGAPPAGAPDVVPRSQRSDAGSPGALLPWTEGLTPREVDVARAVASGASNRAVAGRLSLSVRTVEVHLTSIFRKVGASSRTELALLVMRQDES